MGAVFRNAAALGADAVLVTPGCADPLYRRAVKVSMGAVLGIPWTRTGPDPLEHLDGFTTLALTPAPDALGLDALDLSGHCASATGPGRCSWAPRAPGCPARSRPGPTCACGSRCPPASTR